MFIVIDLLEYLNEVICVRHILTLPVRVSSPEMLTVFINMILLWVLSKKNKSGLSKETIFFKRIIARKGRDYCSRENTVPTILQLLQTKQNIFNLRR